MTKIIVLLTAVKRYLLFVLMLMAAQNCDAQKIFDLKLSLDSSITPQKISFVYHNGIKNIFVTDTFFKRQLELKENFYSEYASFEIRYNHEGQTAYSGIFFINQKPAKISLYYDPNDANTLKYESLENAKPVFDTNSNQLFRKLLSYRRSEARALDDFFAINGYPPYSGDSLKYVFAQKYKAFNSRTVSFLKDYSEDYFSFWYYTNQLIPPSLSFFGSDSAYLKYLTTTFKSIFPDKYVNSAGGKSTINYLEGLINPYVKNELAPSFTGKDLHGANISLNDFKGKYVLLDFWATWCGPCMSALPLIKKMRENYPPDKIEVIGVSTDRSFEQLENVISNKNINWINIWDEDDTITHLFGVAAIPTTILINKEGLIVYRCTGLTGENEKEIADMLEKDL